MIHCEKMDIPQEHLNPAVQAFGLQVVVALIKRIAEQYPGIPWVSVGCGNAAVESQSGFKWHLVDPAPLSWLNSHGLREPYLPVNSSSTRELIEKEPALVNNCVLFLNWPLPNDSTYDIEAVQLLNPVAVLSITELWLGGNGGAGSRGLHEWRQRGEYRMVFDATLVQDNRCQMDMRLSWYQRDNSQVLNIELPTVYRSYIPLHEECTIQ
jgi:hypothetical protein